MLARQLALEVRNLYSIYLWCMVSENRPKGMYKDVPLKDIERGALTLDEAKNIKMDKLDEVGMKDRGQVMSNQNVWK